MHRRSFLRLAGGAGVTAVALPVLGACSKSEVPTTTNAGGSAPGRSSAASPGSMVSGTSPPPPFKGYGVLGAPDANGLRLPAGFGSRVVAVTGEPVASTGYVWPPAPDGGAIFKTDGGGWIYVANSEWGPGGVSMIRFDPQGAIVEAKSILGGTLRNCAGGATPWNTWLSCEEIPKGRVWECDPTGTKPAQVRDAMGVFNHEAAACDDALKVIYLTEDTPTGGLYRFRPTSWGDLSKGTLEVLVSVGPDLKWQPVPDPSAATTPTSQQVAGTKAFNGGEGADMIDDALYFSTKGDNRLWRLDPKGSDGATVSVVWDSTKPKGDATVDAVDNVVRGPNKLPFVAEDGPGVKLVVVASDGTMHPVAQVTTDPGSEITGPAFSPDGTRVYFSSQRPGRTYEVTGPFT